MPRAVKTVTRAAQMPSIRRDAVKAGEVFQVVMKNGLGRKTYGALGTNGKNLSINLDNGELASTSKKDKKVIVVGKFTIRTTALSFPGTPTTRGALGNSDIFRVKGGETVYLNLGRFSDGRYVSVAMGKALGDDYAVTNNAGSHVEKLGTWEMAATITK